MKKGKDIEKLCKDFLICCYFGQSNNLIKAAIDRAYIDMASHTLTGFDDVMKKWECRFNASTVICDGIVTYPGENNDFNEWHEKVIAKIQGCYQLPKLKEGQANKWLNMTIKYLFVFSKLFGINDVRLKSVKTFFENTSESDYKIPIDSFVLKGSGIKDISWSSLGKDDYLKVSEQLGDDKDFMWELECWEILNAKYNTPENDSYAKFFNDKQDTFIDKNAYIVK